MENLIDLDSPVYDLTQAHPELLPLLVDLGFTPLANPLMRKSLGKITTLRQGAHLIRLPLDQIIQTLEWNGYTIKKKIDTTAQATDKKEPKV